MCVIGENVPTWREGIAIHTMMRSRPTIIGLLCGSCPYAIEGMPTALVDIDHSMFN